MSDIKITDAILDFVMEHSEYESIPKDVINVTKALLLMAIAKQRHSSGKELLTALAVGDEIAVRLSNVFLKTMSKSLEETGMTPDVFGNSNEHIIGVAVACGMLMGLSREKLAQCIGMSVALCSLPIFRDWESTMPKTMIKYFPAAWLAQTAVSAVQLAELGYTADAYTLDNPLGFPTIYCRDKEIWKPEKVIEGLGEKCQWATMGLKPYPACRYLHSDLDCFYRLIEEHNFGPVEIEEIRCHSATFVAHPDQMSVSNQIDAQFSGPYVLAMAIYGYEPGPSWQSQIALSDPKLREFMKKVKMITAPRYYELKAQDPLSWYAKVEIDARGKTFVAETDYSKGTNRDGFRITDEELDRSFFNNAQIILPVEKINKAIYGLRYIDQYDDLQEVFQSCIL